MRCKAHLNKAVADLQYSEQFYILSWEWWGGGGDGEDCQGLENHSFQLFQDCKQKLPVLCTLKIPSFSSI